MDDELQVCDTSFAATLRLVYDRPVKDALHNSGADVVERPRPCCHRPQGVMQSIPRDALHDDSLLKLVAAA